jgi:Protein of unknown function (DUF2934)
VIDRAAEQAAIDAHIAARGVTHLPEADPVARAIELWRAEKLEPRGMRKTVAGRVKRAKRRKEAMHHTRAKKAGPHQDNATAPAMTAAGADPPAMRKEVMQHTADTITGPLHNATAPAMIAVGAAPPIASLAYALWEMEGRPRGHDLRHWLTAEAIVTS